MALKCCYQYYAYIDPGVRSDKLGYAKDLFISLKKITGLAVAHHGGPLMTNKVAALAKFLENVTNCHTLEDHCD